MTISFHAEDIELPAIKKEAVSNWIRKVAETYGKRTGDISYIFCSDEKILEVNRQYLQHDYYTDIITFDYTSGNKISGDLFISLDTVNKCGKVRNSIQRRTASYDHPRNPSSVRHQRQRARGEGDHGRKRK